MLQESPINELPADVRTRLRRSAHPTWVSPMLATLVLQPISRKGWLFENKLDGERCLVLRADANVQLLSRNQKQLNDKYPELVAAFHNQKSTRYAVDGEIVTFDGGITSFAKLQKRMQLRHPSEELRRRIPV